MKESAYVDKIKKLLKQVPNCCFEKRHGSVYSSAGQPDISGCVNGKRFEIEVKVDGNVPTVLQLQRLKEWSDAGAWVAVAWNLEFSAITNRIEVQSYCEDIICLGGLDDIKVFIAAINVGERP